MLRTILKHITQLFNIHRKHFDILVKISSTTLLISLKSGTIKTQRPIKVDK